MAGVALGLALVIAGDATTARAQTEAELQRARELFGEGVELVEEERWAEAAERFRLVMEVRATGQVKYNLGIALERSGELAEASSLLREAADDAELDRRTRRDARRVLEAIEPRLAHLTVRVEGDAAAGATVTVDERELSPDQLGQPVAVDPGTRQVAARRGERTIDARSVTLGEGESEEVTLQVTSVPTPAETAAVGMEEEILPREEPAGAQDDLFGQWWFWAGVGGVVVTIVLIGIVASSGGQEPVRGNLMPGILEVSP